MSTRFYSLCLVVAGSDPDFKSTSETDNLLIMNAHKTDKSEISVSSSEHTVSKLTLSSALSTIQFLVSPSDLVNIGPGIGTDGLVSINNHCSQ